MLRPGMVFEIMLFVDVNAGNSEVENDYTDPVHTNSDEVEDYDYSDDDYKKLLTSSLLKVALPIVGFMILASFMCCLLQHLRKYCQNAEPSLPQQSDSGYRQQVLAVPQSQHFLYPREAPPEYVEEPPPAYSSLYYDDNTKEK
ncbi:Chromosomal replication initiator protein DnaA [Orchesella cincta]|uniref:Chromosomal replication initiator protein DnaA n=1 Tax=Orchesella cincta TaxID=48709 RepID=A0A1D2NIJ6_ORCCI|nr:Chromosomal replication initiator protein DnaA [Orchesella cincta]